MAGSRWVPGDAILHPVALASVAVLLVNDHVLKVRWPGTVTGKLSDVAGLVFFPLLLLGIWEVALAVARRWRGPSGRAAVAAVSISGIGFALAKTTDAGAQAFGWLLGIGQWLPGAVADLAASHPVRALAAAPSIVDPTDLVALLALAIPLAIGLRRAISS